MSMVYLPFHNESIYSLDRKEEPALRKPPIHHSKFGKQVRNEREILKDCHKTMGFAEISLRKTDEFLQKGGGVKQPCHEKGRPCSYRRPPIPGKCDIPEIRHYNKNLIQENIKRVVSAQAKKPLPRYADTRNGDFHDLKKSGLMPVYVYQEKFGKVPKYLINRNRDVQRQMEIIRKEDKCKEPLCKYITQEERSELLGGLKQNWMKLQQTYLGLPVLTDTITKAMRKTRMENELKQLEKDILLIENHPYIYVYRDRDEQKISN